MKQKRQRFKWTNTKTRRICVCARRSVACAHHGDCCWASEIVWTVEAKGKWWDRDAVTGGGMRSADSGRKEELRIPNNNKNVMIKYTAGILCTCVEHIINKILFDSINYPSCKLLLSFCKLYLIAMQQQNATHIHTHSHSHIHTRTWVCENCESIAKHVRWLLNTYPIHSKHIEFTLIIMSNIVALTPTNTHTNTTS